MTSKNHKHEDNKAFLDRLTDFLGDSEGQSTEEVKAELRKQGIEIDDMTNNIKALINEKIGEIKRQWMFDAPKLRDKLQKQIESFQENIPMDITIIKAKIKEIMELSEYRDQSLAFFRNFDEMTDDEMRQLYKDFIDLMNLQRDDFKDNE